MEIIDKKTNGGKAYVFLNNLNGEPLTQNTAWIICPTCGGKTRDRIREDTILINHPLYCPKCKQEHLIEAKNFIVTVIREPDTKMQSR